MCVIIVGMMNSHLAHIVVLAHSCNSPAANHHKCTEYILMKPYTVYKAQDTLLSLTSHLQPNETKIAIMSMSSSSCVFVRVSVVLKRTGD